MIKAVIFDLDGTIVDFNLDYKAMRAEVMRYLVKQGLPHSTLSVNEGIFNMLEKMEIYMRNNGKKERDITRVRQAVLSIADRYEMDAARTTTLIPGVLEAMRDLRSKGLKMALFTVSGKKHTDYILRSFQLEGFFDAVITREMVASVKPDPVHLEAALKALNVKPREAVVVGDSVRDIQCAQETHAIAVGVTTGFSPPEELTRAGASHLLFSISDLPTLIQQLDDTTLRER